MREISDILLDKIKSKKEYDFVQNEFSKKLNEAGAFGDGMHFALDCDRVLREWEQGK